MMETYGVLRRKLHYDADGAAGWVYNLREQTVIAPTPDDILGAIRAARKYDISHWDGLILKAAERAAIDIVYTEDLNHGQTYGSVRVCNPFIEDFLA